MGNFPLEAVGGREGGREGGRKRGIKSVQGCAVNSLKLGEWGMGRGGGGGGRRRKKK